jgi:imidazolonepropionase-like amidohydrolase
MKSVLTFGWVLVLAALWAAVADAQDLTIKAPPQSRPIVIDGIDIHTVSRGLVPAGTVVFDGGVITGVFGEGAFDASLLGGKEPVRIDGRGKHLYPGLVGPYSQLGLTEIQSVRPSTDMDEAGGFTPEVRAFVAVNPDSTLLPVTRRNGVLTVGVFPTGGTVSGRASVIQLEGWTSEELTIQSDAGLTLNWPQMRTIDAWWMTRSREEQERDAKQAMEAINRVFDAAAAYASARDADPSVATDVRYEAMRDVLPTAGAAPKRPVFIAATDVDQITAAVDWAAGRGLRVVIVGGRDAGLCTELLRKHSVGVIIGAVFAVPRRADSPTDEAFVLPARLHEAGITFAIASGDDTAHERNLPYAAAKAIAYGLPPEAGLAAVTLGAAKLLGVDSQVGSIEVGKRATLLITDGNPLEVTTVIHRAFISGREIDLSSKQSKLAEKYIEKYRQRGELKDQK